MQHVLGQFTEAQIASDDCVYAREVESTSAQNKASVWMCVIQALNTK